MRPAIRHLLSDIGGVVLQLDFERPAARMSALCDRAAGLSSAALRRAFHEDPMLEAYECGRIDRAAFIDAVRARMGFRGTDEDFVSIWRGMFAPDMAIVAAWREMSGRLRIWYLSNTSDMHVPWVYEAFSDIAVHAGHVLSYEIGVRKPDPAFFRRALARLGDTADACIFVDDNPSNCAAAETLGIASICHVSAEATIAELRRRLEGVA